MNFECRLEYQRGLSLTLLFRSSFKLLSHYLARLSQYKMFIPSSHRSFNAGGLRHTTETVFTQSIFHHHKTNSVLKLPVSNTNYSTLQNTVFLVKSRWKHEKLSNKIHEKCENTFLCWRRCSLSFYIYTFNK